MQRELTYKPVYNADKDESEQLEITLSSLNRRDFFKLTLFDTNTIRANPDNYLDYEKYLVEKYVKIKKAGKPVEVAEIIDDPIYSVVVEEIVVKLLRFSILTDEEKKT